MNHPAPAVSQPPSWNLVGQTIPGGWTVTKQLARPGQPGAEDLSGSFFSQGYLASKGKDQAFLKVIDVIQALIIQDSNLPLMDRLKVIGSSHSFECTILEICAKAKLDRIVSIIGKGELPPPVGSILPVPVPYILFELADGDVRKIVSRTNKIDDAWRLRVLHDVAVGVQQLHGQAIAHQDLKPSNVLLCPGTGRGAKIGDLGRASQKGLEAAHDGNTIAGAIPYAPPEQVYGTRPTEWVDRREGCDLYHVGSLATFLFAGTNPTLFYAQELPPEIRPRLWGGTGASDYAMALPALQAAFVRFVDQVRDNLPSWLQDELSQIIFNACNPDYTRRGDPDARQRQGRPLGIETFVSRFDRLAKRAQFELKKL